MNCSGTHSCAIARPEDETFRTSDNYAYNPQFGSAHPNASNFLIGDGAVRAFSPTTPKWILSALGTVNDGTNVNAVF
jgi:hypothetical protein